MFAALVSFLGGSAFRMIWGEVSAFFTKKQDHKQEMEKMRLQAELEAAQHARNLEAIRVQADLAVKTIEVQSDAKLSEIDAQAWADAVGSVGRTSGNKFIDIWNGAVRPFLATVAIGILLIEIISNNWMPTEHVLVIADAVLGIYVADRTLGKRGK